MANTWGELRSLLDNDTTLEDALGLEQCSESANGRSEKELTVSVQGMSASGTKEAFRYKFPTASDVQLLGLTDIDEPLSVLPPYLDLSQLLEPLYIPEPASDESLQDECSIVHVSSPSITAREVHKRHRQESASPRKFKRSKKESNSPDLLESSDDCVYIDIT